MGMSRMVPRNMPPGHMNPYGSHDQFPQVRLVRSKLSDDRVHSFLTLFLFRVFLECVLHQTPCPVTRRLESLCPCEYRRVLLEEHTSVKLV